MEQITSTATIAILLATYNGERYLGEQLESLLAQTNHDWQLFIHDDGSTDATPNILHQYATAYPDRITVLDYPPQGGSCRNFLSLLSRVVAPYYMFCDQDDVWHPDKVAKTLQLMLATEKDNGRAPVIVHTDLRVVDAALQPLHASFWHYANIRPEAVTSFQDCVMNVVTGCTMLFNAPTRHAALSKSSRLATMHDAWVTCCCYAAQGHVVALPEATIDYRQHGHNCLGAQDGRRLTLQYRIQHFFEILRNHRATYRMLRSIAPYSPWTYFCSKVKKSSIFRSSSEG